MVDGRAIPPVVPSATRPTVDQVPQDHDKHPQCNANEQLSRLYVHTRPDLCIKCMPMQLLPRGTDQGSTV